MTELRIYGTIPLKVIVIESSKNELLVYDYINNLILTRFVNVNNFDGRL